MPKFPYDQDRESWDGKVTVALVFEADNLKHGQYVMSEVEDLINKLNADFIQSQIEPS